MFRARLLEKFMVLASSRQRLLNGSTVYLDAGATEAVAWLGGVRFLLGLGVRNIKSLPDASVTELYSQGSTTTLHEAKSSTSTMAARVRQRGIQFLENEVLAFSANTSSARSGSRKEALPKATAVFFVTTELWYAEKAILYVLDSSNYDRALICCSLSEAAHSCDPRCPKPWGTSARFTYRQYQRLLKRRLQNRVAASRSSNSGQPDSETENACLISVRYFPLVLNAILDSGGIHRSESPETIGSGPRGLALFTLTNGRARGIFPTTPWRLSTENRTATGGSLDRITVEHLPQTTRSTFRLAAHQIVSCLRVLGLDIMGPSSESGNSNESEPPGFALGHKHSALAIGETVVSILSDSEGLLSSSESKSRERGASSESPASSIGALRPAVLFIVDRTMDMATPIAISSGNTYLLGQTIEHVGQEDRARCFAASEEDVEWQIDMLRALVTWPKRKMQRRLDNEITRALSRIASADKHFKRGAEDTFDEDGTNYVQQRAEDMRSAARSSFFSGMEDRRRSHLLDNFLSGIPVKENFAADVQERAALVAVEKLHRQLLSSDNNGDLSETVRGIFDQLCSMLDKTWEVHKSDPSALSISGVMRAILHAFSICSPDKPGISSIKRLRIHMTAALLRADAASVGQLDFVTSDFASKAQEWRSKQSTLENKAPNKDSVTKAALAVEVNGEVSDNSEANSDSWGSDGWGSDFSASDDDDKIRDKGAKERLTNQRVDEKSHQDQLDHQLRVSSEDELGTSLQTNADAIVDEVIQRLLEVGSACSGMKDPNLLIKNSSATSCSSLLGRLSEHIIGLYSSGATSQSANQGTSDSGLSCDLRPLVDYSVKSAIKSGANLVAGALAGLFGGVSNDTKVSSAHRATSPRAQHEVILIFVVGGICATEIAEVNDIIERSTGISVDQVIIGSTKLLKPDEVMNHVFQQ